MNDDDDLARGRSVPVESATGSPRSPQRDSSQHTPGPWTWDGKFTVGIPHAEGDTFFRTNPEDARLIASAPELLDAAHAMVEALDQTKYDVFIGSPTDLMRLTDGRRALVDAIAKAEGR